MSTTTQTDVPEWANWRVSVSQMGASDTEEFESLEAVRDALSGGMVVVPRKRMPSIMAQLDRLQPSHFLTIGLSLTTIMVTRLK